MALVIIDCNHPKDSLDELSLIFFTSQNNKGKRACTRRKKMTVSLKQGQGEVKNVQIQGFVGGKTLSPFSFSLTSYLHLGRWAEQLLKLPGGNHF